MWMRIAPKVLSLLLIDVLVYSQQSYGACKDLRSGFCICLNDKGCKGIDSAYTFEGCDCRNGEDLSMKRVVQRIRETNGTVESLFFGGSDIKSLAPLAKELIEVKHSLVLLGTAVESLVPLRSLVEVGNLTIVRNTGLSSIKGLQNLNRVHDGVTIADNYPLKRVTGWMNLKTIGGNLFISNNWPAQVVSGFSELTAVGGSLKIKEHSDTHLVQGFKSLLSVGREMEICGNAVLRKFKGMPILKRTGGRLVIEENKRLEVIDGLQEVVAVDGDVIVRHNKQADCKPMLENLKDIGGNLLVSDNNFDCASFDLLSRVEKIGAGVRIRDNIFVEASILNNVQEVVDGVDIMANVFKFDRQVSLGFDGHVQFVDSLVSEANALNSTTTELQHGQNDTGTSQDAEQWAKNTSNPVENNNAEIMVIGDDWISEKVQRANGVEAVVDRKQGYIHPTMHEAEIDDNNSFDEKALDLENATGSYDVETAASGPKYKKRAVEMFEKLSIVCKGRTLNDGCAVQIRHNYGMEYVEGFQQLMGYNGALVVKGNDGLRELDFFKKLTYVTKPPLRKRHTFGRDALVTCGLTIAFNPDLTSVDFDALDTVKGDVFVVANPKLDRITFKVLHNITGWTQFSANSINGIDFTSTDPLPYSQSGCRTTINVIASLEHNSSTASAFITRLERNECRVEKLIPTLVGAAIIVAMIIISLLLSWYAFRSQASMTSYRRFSIPGGLQNMLSVSILAMADLFSDVGFSVTAFVVWEGRRGSDQEFALLMISILSAVALIISQGYMLISVYIGLTAGGYGHTRALPGRQNSLLRDLRDGGEMEAKDWFLLFPGLFVLEAGVIKYLPWNHGDVEGQKKTLTDGFPNEHFARIAFIAALLEDVPLIILQIAFMIVIEGEDGWAITGAMGSLTVSAADVLVKFFVPMLAARFNNA